MAVFNVAQLQLPRCGRWNETSGPVNSTPPSRWVHFIEEIPTRPVLTDDSALSTCSKLLLSFVVDHANEQRPATKFGWGKADYLKRPVTGRTGQEPRHTGRPGLLYACNQRGSLHVKGRAPASHIIYSMHCLVERMVPQINICC